MQQTCRSVKERSARTSFFCNDFSVGKSTYFVRDSLFILSTHMSVLDMTTCMYGMIGNPEDTITHYNYHDAEDDFSQAD